MFIVESEILSISRLDQCATEEEVAKVGRGNLEQNLCSRNCREEGNRWTSEIMLTQ